MAVQFFNTYDSIGGAARAAWRIFEAVDAKLGDCRFQSLYRARSDARIESALPAWSGSRARLRTWIDKGPLIAYRARRRIMFNNGWLRSGISRGLADTDIAHLHWVADGFVAVSDIGRLAVPVVWTFHDLWPVTGGCHYPGDCAGYASDCGSCPALESRRTVDLARWNQRRKRLHFRDLPFVVACPSRWLAGEIERSGMFRQARIEVIPNCIDTEIFSPLDRQQARQSLGIPGDGQLLLFGAAGALEDPRKGFPELAAAIRILRSRYVNLDLGLLMFGTDQPRCGLEDDLPVHSLGIVENDRDLRMAYAAADLFVSTSSQDNLPNTLLEAQACGIPCVAYETGGVPETIEPGQTGFLVPLGDSERLAETLASLLSDIQRLREAGRMARERALSQYTYSLIADRYLDAYEAARSLRFKPAPRS
jgi:glycosyltransferase involved in cell wall biosynthesis